MENRERQGRSFSLFLAASSLVFFAAVAAIAIAGWLPVLPEAAAVNITPDQPEAWREYAYLHESWHYIVAMREASASLTCAR